MPVALVELGLKPRELGGLTVKELEACLEYHRERERQKAIRQAEQIVLICNACGMNLKKGITVKDILGFDPYPKQEVHKTREDIEDELHFLKSKLGGGTHGR